MSKRTPLAVLLPAVALTVASAGRLGAIPSGHAVPPPWQTADIGDVGTAGYAVQGPDADLFVGGAGGDIWGAADSFRFVYQPIEDGAISALLGSMTGANPFAKTGVMLRQSLAPDSPHVILDVKPDGGVEFMTREGPGSDTVYLAGGTVPVQPAGSGVSVNAILKLARSQGVVTASVCSGGGCQTIGSTPFPSGLAFIGVAVTSHDPSTLNEASFPANMPSVTTVLDPWFSFDVGPVGLAGRALFQNGAFTVQGAGADIWGTTDAFHFVTQGFNGDGILQARVVSEQNVDTFGKAGLMFRDGDKTVILDIRPNGQLEFMARQAFGAQMMFLGGGTASFPVWLRLVRAVNQFTGFVSDDGVNWTPVAPAATVDMNLNATIQSGLVVTSHDPSALNTSVFDNATIDDESIQDLDIGAVGLAGSATPLGQDSVQITGAGADVWGTADAFNFYYWRFTGDTTIGVRVDSMTAANPFAKAGLMMRASAEPGAANVILDVKPDGGIELMTRDTAGGPTRYIAGSTTSFPVWLLLTLSGSTISASMTQSEGQPYALIATTPSPLPSRALFGLAVTSHDPQVLNTVAFSSLRR